MTRFYNLVDKNTFACTMKERFGWSYEVGKKVFESYGDDGVDDMRYFDPDLLRQSWSYAPACEIVQRFADEYKCYDDSDELFISGRWYSPNDDDGSDIAIAICNDHNCFALAAADGNIVMDSYSSLA